MIQVLLSFNFAHGKVIFHGAYTDSEKQLLSDTIDKVHKFLGETWDYEETLNIVYIPGTQNVYFPSKRVELSTGKEFVTFILEVGKVNVPIFIHEYGHFLMDIYLRRNSSAWRYAMLSYSFNSYDLEIPGSLVTISNFISSLEGMVSSGHIKSQSSLDRMQEQIEYEKMKQAGLQMALEIDKNHKHSLFDRNFLFRAQLYLEMFSDLLAALVVDDWDVIDEEVQVLMTNVLGENHKSVSGISIMERTWHRGFPEGVDPITYDYDNWTKTSVHSQLTPVRSRIREAVKTTNSPLAPQLILSLRESILTEFEALMVPEVSKEPTLRELNISLIESLGL